MRVFKILGTTEDETTCGLCGRSNLKKTVALDRLTVAQSNSTASIAPLKQ